MPIPIQSVDSPIELSADGVTWKVLICVSGYTFQITTNNTTTDTQCGRFIGLGATSFTANPQTVAAYDKTGSQVNQKDILTWIKNKTLLYMRVQSPANGGSYPVGSAYYMSGQTYVTETTLTNATNDPVKFSVTLLGTGDLDVTE